MPEEALTASKSPLAGELLVSIMSSSVSKVDTTADSLPFDILKESLHTSLENKYEHMSEIVLHVAGKQQACFCIVLFDSLYSFGH